MSPTRRFIFLAPLPVAFLLSDKSLPGLAIMLGAGLIFWIPYWLAWWLSDGFSVQIGGDPSVSQQNARLEPTASGLRAGSQGYGLYLGNVRVDQ